jgi:hypothetical protein
MPPVFEKEYKYESQHPVPNTVLAFLLKKEVSARPAKVFQQKTSLGTLNEGVCPL